MEGGGGDGSTAGVSSPFAAVAAAAPASLKNRQRFSIELKPGETTIVSWKKLVREANKSNTLHPAHELPIGANPALESRIALVKDEYFEVDKLPTKHNGFFVNRGKLERINEPMLANYQPKKRRRKDLASRGEEGEHLKNKHAKMGYMRMKAAARNASLVGKKSSSQSQNFATKGEHCKDKNSVTQSDAAIAHSKKKSVDMNMKADSSSSSKSHVDAPVFPSDAKDSERQRTGVLSRDMVVFTLKVASECTDATQLIYQDKCAPSQLDTQSTKPLYYTKEMDVSTKIQEKEKNGRRELPDLNLPTRKHSAQTTETSPMHVKKGYCERPKGVMLQRAIRELEKIVAESRPPIIEVQEVDTSSQVVKRRLPHEVKQKLAKVARLAQSCQGRISEDLVNHLMGILGHIMQLKTLKRNLKEMVELGLSAKQEKDDKLQQIKREVVEMIKMRATSLRSKVNEQQNGASNDFREVLVSEEKGVLKGRYGMDNLMEDKICDLYDQYVEGMDEDKGPLIRKLYIELAELWPNGAMDNHGIKNAIGRAKARKRAMYSRLKNQEKIKQQKLSSTPSMQETIHGEASSVAHPRAVQERVATDSGCQVLTSPNRSVSNFAPITQQLTTSEKMPNSSTNDSSIYRPKQQQKVKRSPSNFLDEARKAMDRTFLKDKLKRKPESDLGVGHFHSEKLSSQQGKERHKSYKRAAANDTHKPSLQLPGFPGLKSSSNML